MNNILKNTEYGSLANRSFESFVTSGGDERLTINENGMNKYFIHPTHFDNVFNRGSCTCSPFTSDGFEVANNLYEKLDEQVFDATRAEHDRKLKELINYEGQDRFDIFYAPSGSDLCYYALLFSKLIYPEKKIYNLITCPEEIGSGSLFAYAGKYFFNNTQFGETVTKDSSISDELIIHSKNFSARTKEGEIIDHRDEILKTIHDNYHDYSIISNLVIGSKSGIETKINIISETPEDVLWVIDLCQFRASKVLINGLIGLNCMVMITGSKFYQCAPFCGALLVPKTISRKFKAADAGIAGVFSNIFSRYDIPAEFPLIREQLKDFRNYGLLLKWEASLYEMLELAKLDSYSVNTSIQKWNEFVVGRLTESDFFELIPGQEITNRSIISFRAKSKDGKYLNHEQLAELHAAISTEIHTGLKCYEKVLIGQPVKYGEKSFIRIALGSYDLRELMSNGFDLSNDHRLVELIEEYICKLF